MSAWGLNACAAELAYASSPVSTHPSIWRIFGQNPIILVVVLSIQSSFYRLLLYNSFPKKRRGKNIHLNAMKKLNIHGVFLQLFPTKKEYIPEISIEKRITKKNIRFSIINQNCLYLMD